METRLRSLAGKFLNKLNEHSVIIKNSSRKIANKVTGSGIGNISIYGKRTTGLKILMMQK